MSSSLGHSECRVEVVLIVVVTALVWREAGEL